MNARIAIAAAAIAGVVTGVLSGLPFLSYLNCLLCGWVWGSGILAVFLYRRYEGSQTSITARQGLLIGICAGLIGCVVSAVMGFVLVNGGASMLASMQTIFRQTSPQTRQFVNQIGARGWAMIVVIFSIVPYTAFGAIGGLVGSALFCKPRTGTGTNHA